VPNSRYDVLAVGTDKKLTSNRPEKHEKSTKMNDLDAYLSSIVIMKSGRCAITGVGEPGRPGELQVWRLTDPIDKTGSVQAHSGAVKCMKLSYDNQWLYTAGSDGIIGIFEVKDRDPRAVKPDASF
jgi:WD40 repeat protein